MRNTPHLSSSRPIALLIALLIVVVSAAALQALTAPGKAAGAPPGPTPGTITGGDPVTWNDVDRLISEQKFEAASETVAAILERARAGVLRIEPQRARQRNLRHVERPGQDDTDEPGVCRRF